MEVQEEIDIENIRIQNNEILKDYQILSPPLYKGIHGEVRKVISKYNNKTRVVKIIRRDLISEDQEERIMRNVGNLQNLRTKLEPGVQRLYEFYEDQYSFYIIQSYCEGQDLMDALLHLPKEKYTESHICKIIQDILKIVDQAHQQDLMHGNFKLSSIAYNQDKQISILDFGLSMTMKEHFQSQDEKPTYLQYFVAPEMLDQEIVTDKKCDIWSVGVIMYLLLSGTMPFEDGEEISLYEEIQAGLLDFGTQIWQIKISKQAKSLLKSLLDLDKETRFSAAQALKHEWFQESDHLTTVISEAQDNFSETVGKIQIKENIQNYFMIRHGILKKQLNIISCYKSYDTNQSKSVSFDQAKQALQMSLNQIDFHEADINLSEKYKDNDQIQYEQMCIDNYLKNKQKQANKCIENMTSIKNNLLKNSINTGKIYFHKSEIKKLVGTTQYIQLKGKLAQHSTKEGAIPFLNFEQILKGFIKEDSEKDNISKLFSDVEIKQDDCQCYCNIF